MSASNHTKRDRELGMDRPITRRDFLDGVAIAIGAAGLAPPLFAANAFPQDRRATTLPR
jgi:spermidine dehydrogenase